MRLRRKAARAGRPDPAPATPFASRVFVEPEVTPEALVALYQQHLTSDATEIVGPNLGRWMRVTGARGDVVPRKHGASLLRFDRRGVRGATRIEMNFSGPEWQARLGEVPRGTEIAVVGVLRAATQSQITLDHCELDQTISP